MINEKEMEALISKEKLGPWGEIRLDDSVRISSNDLIRGCGYVAEKAEETKNRDETVFFNTSCVHFATSAIEAKLNEWISVLYQIKDEDDQDLFWEELKNIQRTLGIEEKWNLIASAHSGKAWNGRNEPFKSYETIITIRNELVNHRTQLSNKKKSLDENIRDLLLRFGLNSDNYGNENAVKSWISDLLAVKGLGGWIYSKTVDFESRFLRLLIGKT